MKKFFVIIWNPNKKGFEDYDIMPYLYRTYYDVKKSKYEKIPKTFEEFKEFVDKELMYQFWGRCEYEMLISDWPSDKVTKKIDVYRQCKPNLDIIANLLMESI